MTADLEGAMGSLRGSEGRARRSLKSLQASPGYVVLSGPDRAPDRVRIKPWVEVTYWRRVHGGGDGGLYEAEPNSPVLIIDGNGEYLAGGGR